MRGSRETIRYTLDDKFLELPNRGHFGQFVRSPNRRFVLTWLDGDPAGLVSGARAAGAGPYILLDDDRIVCEGHLERPNDGKVANDGTFILNDWHFSLELSGTFFAFDSDGRELLRRTFQANLYNNGISPDGQFACCQTCYSKTRDSSLLTVFDLGLGKECGAWRPESGWANSYEFLPDQGQIWLSYLGGNSFPYQLTGKFLGREQWIDNGLKEGDLQMVRRVLDEATDSLPKSVLTRLKRAAEKGLGRATADDPKNRALGWRLKGECFDRMGDLSSALDCYKQAMTYNPKVGVRKRAEAIKGRLQS